MRATVVSERRLRRHTHRGRTRLVAVCRATSQRTPDPGSGVPSVPRCLPESRACLDYAQLDLRKFTAGATIVQRRADSGTQRAWMTVADPLREPKFLLPTLAFPLGSLADKVRLVLAVVALKLCSLDSIFAQDDVPLSVHLRERLRLSEEITGAFFTPFLRGIFLAPLQEQSTILFQFVLKMFLEGSACLPGAPGGIGAVPAMLARSITEQTDVDGSCGSTIQLSARVETLHLQQPRHVVIKLVDGSAAPLYCDSVVVATPRREAKDSSATRSLMQAKVLAAAVMRATHRMRGRRWDPRACITPYRTRHQCKIPFWCSTAIWRATATAMGTVASSTPSVFLRS